MFDIRALLAALGRPPRPAGALARGLAELARGRYGEADTAFGEALREARDDAARAIVHNKRGVALIGLQRPQDALEAFASALTCDADYAPALVNIGNLLLEDGHVLDAIDYYSAAVRADEGYALAHRNLGIAYKRAGKRVESVRSLRTADRLEVRPFRRRA